MAVKGDETPGAVFVVGPAGVVGLADVGTVANRHEALQVESKLLATYPQLQRPVAYRLGERDKRQFQVEPVLIDRCQHRFPGSKVALKLHKGLQLRINPEVGMKFVPGDDVILVTIGPGTEVGGIVGLKPIASVRAE